MSIFEHGHALIIGVNSFPQQAAVDDTGIARAAELVATSLANPKSCGYPPAQVQLLRGQEATRGNILDACDELVRRVASDDVVLCYYCGTGLQTGDHDYRLATYDSTIGGTPQDDATDIRIVQLLERLVSLPARHVLLLLEWCQGTGLAAVAQSYPRWDCFQPFVTSGPHRLVIAAGRPDQLSQPNDGGTLFGKALADGLRGRGDQIVNRAGHIGVYDLYTELYFTVQEAAERAGYTQEPVLLIAANGADFPASLYQGDASPGAFLPQSKPADGIVDVSTLPASSPSPQPTVPATNGDEGSRDPGATPTIRVERLQVAGRDAVGGHQVRGGRDAAGRDLNINNYWKPEEDIIPQPSQPEADYIKRDEETQIRAALLDDDDEHPITLLWAPSGSGKTWLAKSIAWNLFIAQHFPGGVILTPNCNELSDEQIFRDMLRRCGRKWFDNEQTTIDQAMFWQKLNDRYATDDDTPPRRTLIILDNLRDGRQLKKLQPDRPTRNRVLAISHQNFDGSDLRLCEEHRYTLDPFGDLQVKELFRKVLMYERIDDHEDAIKKLASRTSQFPLPLTRLAYRIKAAKSTPQRYLLQQDRGEQPLDIAVELDLERDLQDLKEHQLEMFTLTSLLSDTLWTSEMLAAMTLHPMTEVREALDMLVQRNLIAREADRYQTRYAPDARYRMSQRPEYEQKVAPRLLARFCLDLVQDAVARIVARQNLQPLDMNGRMNPAFFIALQPELTADTMHIRSALQRLIQYEVWDLLKRFAFHPYLGLLQYIVGDVRRAEIDQSMATLSMLHLARNRFQRPLQSLDRLIQSHNIVPSLDKMCHVDFEHGYVTTGKSAKSQQNEQQWIEAERQELSLRLVACQLRSAFITQADVIDCDCYGVRAAGSVFRDVEIVAARLVACDLTRSIWDHCRAPRTSFQASNLSYAVFCATNLRGADFRGVDLTGAVFERVDLRRAKLRGAKFVGVTMRGVNLLGAELDETVWHGARLDLDTIIAEPASLAEIQASAQQTPATPIEQPFGWMGFSRMLDRNAFTGRFQAPDFRAAHLHRSVFLGVEMPEADFTAAALDNTVFGLGPAGTTDAIPPGKGPDLTRAKFFAADLERAVFELVNLTGADFTAADLSGAVFKQCVLKGANLTNAVARDTVLTNADLSNATLLLADLRQADLTGAVCFGTNFEGTNISNEQLAKTQTLARAILPSGARVETFDGIMREVTVNFSETLRHPEFTGLFENVAFYQLDSAYASLPGSFRDCAFLQASMRAAVLSGTFQNVHISEARFAHAQFSGSLQTLDVYDTEFVACQFSGRFDSISFVRCAFIENNQFFGSLQNISFILTHFDSAMPGGQIVRLYGSTFADHSRYDGSLSLPGDIEDARFLGLDTNDPAVMADYYAAPPVDPIDIRRLDEALRTQLTALPLSIYKQSEELIGQLLSTDTISREAVSAGLGAVEKRLADLPELPREFVATAAEMAYVLRKIALRHVTLASTNRSTPSPSTD